jgi:alpha-beta hydrolase superfamily lysophospholipase
VESKKDAAQPTQGRRGLRLLLVVLAGSVVGVLIALRFIDGVSRERIPTAGLIYLGVFFTVGGLLYLVPRFWQWQAGRSTWSGKTVFGTMPPRDALPGWRRVLWDLQDVLVARDRQRNEAMRRDPRPGQLRASAVTLSMGVTILLYAALR